MCGLKAAQMNERPFKAIKELVHPSDEQWYFFFAFGNADCDFLAFIIHELVACVLLLFIVIIIIMNLRSR